jgi:hypothetical protein
MTRLILPSDSPITPADVHVGSDGQVRVGNLLTRAEYQAIERIRNGRFFLFRNDGGEMGERAPCRWHKSDAQSRLGNVFKPVYHYYFTYMCAERPFRGLENGLRAWIQLLPDSERKQRILQGWGLGMRDYASSHPLTSKSLLTADPDVLSWYSLIIGGPEEIREDRAKRLAEKINDRRPPVPFIL